MTVAIQQSAGSTDACEALDRNRDHRPESRGRRKMPVISDENKVIWIGIGVAALLWILESLIHVVMFQEGDFVQQLFSPDPHELWMRLLTLVLILIFSIYAQNIINRRRRAEQETKRVHAELDQIFQTAADGMRVVDKDYNVLRINNTLLDLVGISKDEALGMKCYEAFSCSQCHTASCPLTRILDSEEHIVCDVEKERRDGSRVPCIVTATAFRKPDGELIGIVEDFKDISDLKQAQDALAVEREQLAVTLRSIGDGVIVTNTDGNVTLLNKVAEELTGWSDDEASGRPLSEVFHIINEKTREVCENPVEKVLETGLVFGLANDTALIARDGTERSIADSGAPIHDKDNKTLGVVLVFRDVTEEKRAEEALHASETKFKALWETVQGGIIVVDAKTHTINSVNPAAVNLIGVPKEEIIGSICHKFICPAEEGKCPITDLGQKVDWSERVLLNSRGESIPVFKSVTKMTIGGHDYLVENFIDITDRKQAQDALNKVNEKLNLLSSVTRHDILNQITALAGYTDLLSDVLPDDPEMQKYIDRIMKATSAIERQITFTRDYEHLGMAPSLWQRVGDVAERAAASGGCAERGVSVSTDTGALEVFADPMLEKVFHNLFDNAVRHGGHVTEISVTCREDEDGKMVIAVEDDGIGIPAEMKERIFRHGYGRHTGYGLFLVQEILAITGMSIRETGEEGKGACFEITVPHNVWRLDSEGM